MYDEHPTLRLYNDGPLSQQIDAGRAYLTSTLETETGYEATRQRLVELELVMSGWAITARERENAQREADQALRLKQERPWWSRLFRTYTVRIA